MRAPSKPPATAENRILALQRLIGNVALTSLLVQRDVGSGHYNAGYQDGKAGGDATPGPRVGDWLTDYNEGYAKGHYEYSKGQYFAQTDLSYQGWLTEAAAGQGNAWPNAAEELNGMSPHDINQRLAQLSNDQIAQLEQGAINNPRVGSGAQIVRLCAEALVSRRGSATGVVPTPETAGGVVGTLAGMLGGYQRIRDLKEAKEVYDEIKENWDALKEALEGAELGPAFMFLKLIKKMAVNLFHDLETEEQGCRLRAWCYTVMYEPLGMGSPLRPTFVGRSHLASHDELNGKYWDKGTSEAHAALADGTNGVRLINNILLLVAAKGTPGKVLNEIWRTSCEEAKYKWTLMAYEELPWPGPLGI